MSNGSSWRQYTKEGKDFKEKEILLPHYAERGFLPEQDPLCAFPTDSPYTVLDQIGRDLPDLLQEKHFRSYVDDLKIPQWCGVSTENSLPALRLYYLRLGFLASAYINQVGQEACHVLPANIAVPLVRACKLLNRPPILSYDGYALYNWKRFRKNEAICLGNIDTIQNFVHLYDEHWFILIHVEIEAIAASILGAIAQIYRKINISPEEDVNPELWRIAGAISRQVQVLRRIPERMNPALYHKTFRPYIRFFENVVYQGIDQEPIQFRGETGAQSSIMPVLVALTKIPHQSSILTKHLEDMRNYMPAPHNRLIQEVWEIPSLRNAANREPFNAILDGMIEFRTVHYSWANEYIHKHVADPRGTGGTPYMQWLNHLILETEAHKLDRQPL